MHPLQLAYPLPDLPHLALYAIIRADWERNYCYTQYTPAYNLGMLLQLVKAGGIVCYLDKVILVGQVHENGVFEFHSVNGGGVRNLLRAMRSFLQKLAETVELAATWYDNPRIGEMASHLGFPFKTVKVNEGPDRTFCTAFRLRS